MILVQLQILPPHIYSPILFPLTNVFQCVQCNKWTEFGEVKKFRKEELVKQNFVA